jgi:hypothetical protein
VKRLRKGDNGTVEEDSAKQYIGMKWEEPEERGRRRLQYSHTLKSANGFAR